MDTRFTSLMIVALLTAGPIAASAGQREVTPAVEMTALRGLAQSIPLGTRVNVQTTGGRRLKATLMAVSEEGIVVKREGRISEAAVAIPFREIIQLHRDESSGMGFAKALGVGLGAGAAAMLTAFLISAAVY